MTDHNDMQHKDVDQEQQEKQQIYSLLHRIEQEAKEYAAELDMPVSAGYDLLAVINRQVLLAEMKAFEMEEKLPSSESAYSPSQPSLSTLREKVSSPKDEWDIQPRTFDDSFSCLYDRYYCELVSYLRRRFQYLNAEDLAQECFEKAYHYLEKHGNDIQNVRGWLFSTAVNCARSMKRRSEALDKQLLDPAQLEDQGEDIGDGNWDEDPVRMAEVNMLIRKLPPIQQELIVLSANGYSVTEIARFLDLQPDTTRVLLARAYKGLRQSQSQSQLSKESNE
jgi:RNA polymerase sigma factor (sigma-70 family)